MNSVDQICVKEDRTYLHLVKQTRAWARTQYLIPRRHKAWSPTAPSQNKRQMRRTKLQKWREEGLCCAELRPHYERGGRSSINSSSNNNNNGW
jgi:hypothetical protein